jgi:hypothetical protein
MLVSNLQQFLRSLAPALSTLGLNATADKSVATKLEELAAALEPFHAQTTESLSEALRAADHLRQTGQLPDWILAPKKPARTRTATPKAPKLTVDAAVAHLRDVLDRCAHLEAHEIAAEVQKLKALTIADLKKVQHEFLGATLGKKKDEQLAELQKRIDDVRESQARAQAIVNQ